MANNPPYSSMQPLQPPLVSSMDPPRNFVPPMAMQFRPVIPPQLSPQFLPVPSPHFQPAGFPSHPPQPQYSQLPARPGPPGPGPPNFQAPVNYSASLGGPGAPLSSSYSFIPPSYGQPPVAFNSAAQYQPMAHLQAPNQSTTPVTPVQSSGEQPSVTTSNASTVYVQSTKPPEVPVTDWRENIAPNGRSYYYNKRTRESCWEKPYDLMTPIERADASTDWKEFTSPDGKKYYYNKITKQSKWDIPEELKLARERAENSSTVEPQTENSGDSQSRVSILPAVDKKVSNENTSSLIAQAEPSSPTSIAPIAASGNSQSQPVPELSASPVQASSIANNPDEVEKSENPISGISEVTPTGIDIATTQINHSSNLTGVDDPNSAVNASAQDKEDAAKDVPVTEKLDSISSEEKAVSQEPLAYVDKQEAKNAFKALLESANVGSDSTWEQAMRLIINDKRYGALKTLGERKQVFNEYLGQKKKQDAEERRTKHKKAREEFKNMLEESRELKPTTKWSKAMTMFENDERFKAVERERDRRDLYDAFLQELEEKEKTKLQEERKRNLVEYRQFLESCDFIKASTQWRKVQDRLEADERCNRLEKIDRLEIFQEYLCDLDKEEEEQRKIQKEELRKAERKNRDEFRKLLEEHVAAGTLTAKTIWRDYYLEVKDLPAYLAVASNCSGSTPKDLFEDVAEELQQKYQDDKSWIKDAVKLKKVALASTWTFEDFKVAVMEDSSTRTISDVNQKIIFEELMERAKEKEEKEAKKRRRLSDNFLNLLHSIEEITASSEWENSKELLEGSREFSSIGEESICKEIFDEYVSQLKEHAKDNERRRKEEKARREKEREERDWRKGKHRKDRERGHGREREHSKKDEADIENTNIVEDHINDIKRSGSDSNKKQRRRHHDSVDDFDEDEKDASKSSHKHSNDNKKSRLRASTPDSDEESRQKRHKRDQHNGSHRNESRDELEDGEFGDNGETQ